MYIEILLLACTWFSMESQEHDEDTTPALITDEPVVAQAAKPRYTPLPELVALKRLRKSASAPDLRYKRR